MITRAKPDEAVEATQRIKAVSKRDQRDTRPRIDHRMDVGPLIGLHVEYLRGIQNFTTAETADDVNLVLQGGSARVRSLPVHRRYHLPLVPLRFVSFPWAHSGAAIVPAECVYLSSWWSMSHVWNDSRIKVFVFRSCHNLSFVLTSSNDWRFKTILLIGGTFEIWTFRFQWKKTCHFLVETLKNQDCYIL